MAKKILKIVGIVLLLLVAALVSVPFLFKDKIKEKVVEAVNENLNAKVSFDDVSLSLFKNFPKATVSLENLKVINIAPFEGDTLVYANKIGGAVDLKEILFKKDGEPYQLKSFYIENANVNVISDKDGKANYDITEPTEDKEESAPVSLKVDGYEVKNVKITYKDEKSKMYAVLDSLYHEGKGDFANEVLDLDTKTKTNITFVMDKTKMANNIHFALDAVLGLDLKNQKYSFKQNKAFINKLELAFDGYVKMLEKGQEINLAFKTPSTSFENFLALIPEAYTKSMKGVQTSGSFTVDGKVNGVNSDNTIPKIDIKMLSKNSSFKYPDLPKTVKNIDIDVKVGNDTGILDDTFVNVNNFAFSIDQDHFQSGMKVTNLIKNPNINGNAKGVINLANITKAYPVKMDLDLKGILKADMGFAFDMASVEKKIYENVKGSGSASLEGFVYNGAGLVNPFNIQKAGLNFNTVKIQLTDFIATSGKSDFAIKGFIDNFYGFMFRNEILKGDFSLKSKTIAVADFMSRDNKGEKKAEEGKTEEKKDAKSAASSIKVPAFLDCTFNADINKVLYDNLVLENVLGKLIVKDEKVRLENLQTNIFDGKIIVSGDVSTKEAKPKFNFKMYIGRLSIVKSMRDLEMLSKIAPVANALEGFFSSDVVVSGDLNSDMTPDMKSIKGNLMASLLEGHVKKDGTPLVSKLDATFPKLGIGGKALKDIKANMSFDDGKVNVKPFDIKLADNAVVNVSGTHGFDQNIDYKVGMNVAPSLLGGDVEKALSKLTDAEVKNLKDIPVNFSITGDFAHPKVNVNLKEVATSLATEVAKAQANKAINKGVDKAMEVIGKDKNAQKVLDAVGGLLGGKKDDKKVDGKEQTQAQKDSANAKKKEDVKNALKGLFKKKTN